MDSPTVQQVISSVMMICTLLCVLFEEKLQSLGRVCCWEDYDQWESRLLEVESGIVLAALTQ